MNFYFLLALLSSALGPVLYYVLSPNARVSRFFDGVILTALVGLITLHILPESMEHLGMGTIIAVILGLVGPVFLSQLTKRQECEIQKPFLLMTLLGFFGPQHAGWRGLNHSPRRNAQHASAGLSGDFSSFV